MSKKKTPPPRALSSFDDLDAAGIGAGYVSPFTPGDAPAADEPPKSRGLLAVANDTVIEAANATAGGLSSAANFIKPGNAVSGWIDKNIIQAGEESQSDVVKASKKKFREGVANADGVMGELGAVGGYIVENPLLAAAQAAGSFVGPGAAVKGAGMAARAAGVGAKGIERAGRAGGVAAGAAMAGGDAAGTAYDLAIKAGATEEEATAAARQASVIPALVGGAGGAFGAEKLLAGAKGFGGGAAARAAKTGLSEAAQEAVEEGVTQYEGQRAAIPFDPSIDPSKGVAAAAGMGAALGGMTGAGTSLLTGGHGAGQTAANPLDEAINRRAAESGAPSQPLALPAPTITVDGTGVARTADDRNMVLQRGADGSFVDMTEVPGQAPLPDPEMLALPAPVIQVDGAGNAITSEDRNAQAQQDLEARAARRQRLDSGDILDVTPVPHAPGFVPPEPAPAPVVPERGALSRAANLGAAATQQAAPAMPALGTQNNERPEVAAQGVDAETGGISPEERAGQIQEHLNFLSLMGRNQGWTNEALAQRTALQQELDLLSPAQRMADLQDQAAEAEARAADWAGRQYRPNPTELPEHAANGGPADIQEANEQRRLKNIQQAQQEAAAARAQVDQVEGEGNAQAQLAAQQDRAARVAQAAPDILNKQGKPFTVKLPAVKAAQAAGAGWEPVKVEGGYVVRQVQPTDSPAPTAPKVATPAPQEAMAKAEEIAREGNAQRQQVAQADQDAGARWDAMQPYAQRAVLAAVPKMAKVIRQNLEGKAWEKMSAGNREKVLGAMNSVAATEQQQKNSEEKPIEGKDLGNGWSAFAPESGTKSVPRAQMPQIKAEHRGAMVNFMNARGIAHQEETVPAASLKPTQAEFSREKVKKALGYEGGDRSILVSQDGHVLDGHHQWMAAREQGKDVKTIRLDAPIEQLLEAAHEFPSSSTSGGAVDSKAAGAERSDAAFTPSVGMAVEITSGLYAGNSGTVESVSDTGRVVVRGNNELATGFATTAGDLAPSTQQAPTSGQFPLAEADRSYSGISRSGSQRAKGDRDAFEQFMAKAEQSGAAVATTEVQRQAASAALEALRTDYLAQYRSLMNTRSGAYSGFVAGRGNLNSKQANSRNAALDKAMQRFDTWTAENADRVHRAVLAARTPEQVKADRDAATARIQEKADKKAANLKATLLKFLSVKSGESMPYGKNAILTKVSYDRDGYPSSLTFKMADGSPLTDDKVELVATLKDRGETLAQAKARIRALVDEVRAENPQLNGGAGAIREAAPDKAAKPKSVPAKIAEAEAARADYFTPGNIVKSYGGHDRVIAYTAPDADGQWSVKVQAVEKDGNAWVDMPSEAQRTHATEPDARALKAGPVQRAPAKESQAAPKAEAVPVSFLGRHNAIEDGINSGQLALDDYKSAFAELESNQDAVLSELRQLTKDKLLRAGGPAFAYRMGSEKKDAIVLAAYQKMLDTYALGRSYGPSSYFLSADSIAKNKADKAQALRELVGNTTAEDLAARAAEIKALRDEFKAKRAAEADALANPKTLQDFRGFMSHWADQGESSQAAYLRLTPEQRQQFDALEAAQTKDQREAEKRRARVTVQSAGNTTTGEIIATKHTKHGHDLFVVQLAERVERDAYDTLNSSAKRLGGSYSSYRGNGAVPGFQFRTHEAAEAFQKLVGGDTAQAQDLANQRRDAFEDDKSQTTVERLRAMAEALDQGADEQLGADRKTNTARRARMANAAEDAARGSKAYAATMRNLADAIEAGKVQFLDGVRTKTQLTQLLQALGSAKVQQLMAKHGSWAAVEENKHAPMDAQTVDFAEFPRFTMYRSDLAGLARQLLEIDGGKKMGAALARLADDVTDAYTSWAKDNLLSVSHFGNKTKGGFADYASKDLAERAIKRSGLVGKTVVLQIKRGQNRVILSPGEAMQQGLWQGDGDKRIQLGMPFVEDLAKLGKRKGSKVLALPWQLESTLEKRQRLQRMGIQTPAEFRSALRELQNLRQERAEPDRIKQLERSMVGRSNDGLDFFPTGAAATEAAIDAAEIQPGMEVLEPHAGMAHIADAIREQTGVEPDVAELSNTRRELLEAKGYNLVGSDFLELQGKQYDRIVMNPPFSNGRDIQHVQHAYGLLKPGGRLVAIVGEGAFFQSNKRAEGFREWLDERGATNEKLPEGSFMDPSLPVNTGVSARMVVIDKPATQAADESDTRFRRQDADADFDVDSFLQAMNDGQPVAQARAEAVSAVQKTVDAIRAGWANGPEVTVVYDMADPAIPAAARRADQAQRSGGADGDPEGFYYGGKAYLLASQLHTDKDVARVLMHEALGHHGLRGVFGTGLDSVLEQIVAVRRGDVRRKAAEYGLDYDKPAHRLQAAEEVLAEWAQTRPEMGFVRRAVAAIRSWLRQHVPGFKGMRVTDDELIRAYILPARGWVERGAGAGMAGDIAFSRTSATSMPDAIIGSTLGSASSHPDYAAAKGGDIEAAVRLAKDLVTPELLAKVKAVIGDSKPLVVPVAAEEAAGRNKIPRASAEVLALRLGLDTAFDIVQANRARRTGMDGLDRLFAPVDFEGAVEPGSYLLLDDTLTQGGTFAALASHIREGGGTVAGVIALTGKQYSAKIQPSVETLASLRQKHGDLENEFRAATGYGFDSLTESEARYLARYEPADRLRDRISEEGRRGRARQDQGDSGPGAVSDGPLFSRSRLADIKGSALSQLDNILSHPGKVSMWDKTVGTMRHLAERNPFFKPVYESAQQNIDDVSMLANDAADQAPRILPRVDSMGDILGKNRKRPVSAADNKAVARPLFEGTLLWGRDLNGQAVLVEDLAKKYANLSAHNKAAMLLKANRIDAGVLAMWQGLPAQQYENMINSRFESKILKAGVVWSDKELQSQFGATADQISLYREARAAIDRSIDMTARADMMRTLGDEYAAMRDAVLEQPSLDSAGQLLLDMLEQDAKAVPDNRDRLAIQMQQIRKRLEDAKALQESGYAPLSRFGRFTVDVVDAAGERQYFGMYETMREANTAARNFRLTFPDATVEQGTMSQQAYKLFAGVTPESLELFGNMLGLDSEGNEAQDKAFQEYLKLTKNNHSALKRMIHRKGTAGFSEDVGRVVANFVYSNARQAAAGLNVGALDKAINAIPKDQGELKDLAMGLRSYIQDPQEEGQAVRGMLFAQYLGGSLASAFVNMTQPFQVTLPWLSQYGGMKKAGAQLARALKDMGTKGFQYEADLAKALQSAEDDGVVSPQEIHQLMSQARGSGALRAGDGTAAGNARATAANAWERTKVAWGQPFALAEQFNRRSTFIASYRLAKEQGIQNPSAFARKAVLDTQFVYSKAVKPQWARGTIGGTLFTFKTYSVSYLELMQRMWNQGPAGSPERAAGRRAVGWSIAMLMLMGGAGGLPFAEDIEDLIDAGGQLMGYSMSVKQWRKQLMQDVLGKELADFIEQGVSGLPGAPVDISGRLGMGNLIPGTGLFLEKRDHSRDMLEIIGPAGDLIQRAATGARKALTGDIAGAALEVSPTAVRNLAKGYDMADSGIYKDSKGRKVIDVTLGEAVAKAVGFQPKSVAETQEATATEQNLIGQNRAMKERLTADMAQAVYDKDVERQAEIRERQQAWNRRNPESPVFIDRRSVRQRVIKMRQTKAERVAAAAPKSIRANVRQSLAEAQGGTTAP
ncbi:PLxRFG domain-containing protein [Comamonas thiooxydans]|uniref:PLxRFG domain-containing protein n=1 Tax=Comamonas thiooxydans TaxID=363952 RepID=UPI00244C1B2E|nr:PLxRFG domain-containing protein [Comamonas thiooxydans]MDH1477557.1 PLxRFG domain-containing protein [Comamonas thiooxydans]